MSTCSEPQTENLSSLLPYAACPGPLAGPKHDAEDQPPAKQSRELGYRGVVFLGDGECMDDGTILAPKPFTECKTFLDES